MATRVAEYKGKCQGKRYVLWAENDKTWSVEKVWGAGIDGVIFKSEETWFRGYSEARAFLKGIGAKQTKSYGYEF